MCATHEDTLRPHTPWKWVWLDCIPYALLLLLTIPGRQQYSRVATQLHPVSEQSVVDPGHSHMLAHLGHQLSLNLDQLNNTSQ